MISVVFMGTPDIAVPPLQALIDAPDITVQAVFCSPDKPVGRKQVLTAPPTKVLAEAHNIPVHQPASLKKDPQVQALLEDYAPDFFVVIAYGFIIPQRILDIPKVMPMNIHLSLLPKYRGASPVQAALLNGDETTGITFMEMQAAMDAGPMLKSYTCPITNEDTTATVTDKVSTLAGAHVVEMLHEIQAGASSGTPQVEEDATFCHKLSKTDGHITPFIEDALTLHRKWQAFTPWPGIYSTLGGKRVKFLAVSPSLEDIEIAPGQFGAGSTSPLLLGTAKGNLEVQMLQIEGKRAMTATEFLAGNPELLGSTLDQGE